MANLKDLILLRNDPEIAMDFLRAAKNGDTNAQYGMGLIYAEGRGVEQDEAKAFFWLTVAHEQGDEHAEVLRRVVASTMTAEQFAQAELLLKEHTSKSVLSSGRTRRRRKRDQRSRALH